MFPEFDCSEIDWPLQIMVRNRPMIMTVEVGVIPEVVGVFIPAVIPADVHVVPVFAQLLRLVSFRPIASALFPVRLFIVSACSTPALRLSPRLP